MENEAGALSRVSGLFSARGYNIESLTVAPTEDPSMSRITIVSIGSDDIIEQITKQLNKLIEVIKVVDISEAAHIERELMLVKVRATGKDREEMKRMADIFRGRIIDVTDKSYTIELTGNTAKLDAFLEAIDRTLILETVRTGASGIGRGDRVFSKFSDERRMAGVVACIAPIFFKDGNMKVYYDKDADLSLIKGKKVTIVGYGSQGHAHATQPEGFRRQGHRRPAQGRRLLEQGQVAAGLSVKEVGEAVKAADLVMILLPDENIGQVYREEVEPNIKKGAALAFAHGFNIHYGQVQPRKPTLTSS